MSGRRQKAGLLYRIVKPFTVVRCSYIIIFSEQYHSGHETYDSEDALSLSGTECACSGQSAFRVAELETNDVIDGWQN